MAVRSVGIASLAGVFLIGAVAAINPRLGIAAIIVGLLGLLGFVIRTRYRDLYSLWPKSIVQSDWILVLLPTALAIRSFSQSASVLAIGLLVAIAFVRKPQGRFRVEAGPLLLLLATSAIVFSRSASTGSLVTYILVGALVIRLVMVVDARRIIASIIDGCGLYLVANLFGWAIGLQSPLADLRLSGLVESAGSIRIIYPFTSALNTPPTIAAVYVVAFCFLVLETSGLRRVLRSVAFIAAIVILAGAGTRTPMAVTAVLSVAVICFPPITRWIAQAATVFAAASAFVLPALLTSFQSAVTPLISLAPGRLIEAGTVSSLNNRDYIWDKSIGYWTTWIKDPIHVLFGFGQHGQYKSGASLTYSDRFEHLVRNPELTSVHNTFLQQLFDGGILGCLLLVLALYWASSRLSKRRQEWGLWAQAAIVAMAAFLLSGMTEVSVAPGAAQDSFWLVIVLVGVACQTVGSDAEGSVLKRTGHGVTATV